MSEKYEVKDNKAIFSNLLIIKIVVILCLLTVACNQKLNFKSHHIEKIVVKSRWNLFATSFTRIDRDDMLKVESLILDSKKDIKRVSNSLNQAIKSQNEKENDYYALLYIYYLNGNIDSIDVFKRQIEINNKRYKFERNSRMILDTIISNFYYSKFPGYIN